MNRDTRSSEEKTAIFLEMIREYASMAAICTRHRVSISGLSLARVIRGSGVQGYGDIVLVELA